MLKEAWGEKILEPSSNLILSIIICDKNAFTSFPYILISNEHLETHSDIVLNEFNKLLTNIQFSLNRPNRIKFQENIKNFIWNIKTIL